MTDKIERYTQRPFGPHVGRTTIPEDLINKLNKYVDEIILDKEKGKIQDHGKNLVGNVAQEFVLENKFMKECGWGDFLGQEVSHWIQSSTGKKISKFNLMNSWIVRQFQNEYNPLHFHNGHVSGVGYLKVPKNFGETFQKDKKANLNGKIQLVHGSHHFLSKSQLTITPKVGEFYFFPNYLMHTVYPFYNNNEERRSISFNAYIDNDIYES